MCRNGSASNSPPTPSSGPVSGCTDLHSPRYCRICPTSAKLTIQCPSFHSLRSPWFPRPRSVVEPTLYQALAKDDAPLFVVRETFRRATVVALVRGTSANHSEVRSEQPDPAVYGGNRKRDSGAITAHGYHFWISETQRQRKFIGQRILDMLF